MSDYFYRLVAIRNQNLSELTKRIDNTMYRLIYPEGEIATRMYAEYAWVDDPHYYTRPSRRLDSGIYSLFLFGIRWGYGSVRACNMVDGTPLVRVSTTLQLGFSSIENMGLFDDDFIYNIVDKNVDMADPHLSLILRPDAVHNRGCRSLRLV